MQEDETLIEQVFFSKEMAVSYLLLIHRNRVLAYGTARFGVTLDKTCFGRKRPDKVKPSLEVGQGNFRLWYPVKYFKEGLSIELFEIFRGRVAKENLGGLYGLFPFLLSMH